MSEKKETIRTYAARNGWDEVIRKCMGKEPERKESGGQEWVYRCRWHDDHDPSLRINERTGLYNCLACGVGGDAFDLWQETHGCDFSVACDQIAEAFGIGSGATTSTAEAGVTLETLADAKGLSIHDLQEWGITETTHKGHPAVRMPYLNEKGEEITYSLRLALEGKDRFYVPFGTSRELYGLNWLPVAKDQDRVILVEGQSDCWTGWIHDIPTVGIPGANGWNQDWTQRFESISNVFVIKEPDKAGATLVEKLEKSFKERLRVVELPAKDLNELYLQDRANFRERLEECLANAYGLEIEPPPVDESLANAGRPGITLPPALTLSDLTAMAEVEWLYEKWIPKGAVTLIAGETGIGKSFLACYFIACATGTLPWPDGTRSERHRVCLLETESMRVELGRRLARLGLRDDDALIVPYREDVDGGWYIPRLPDDLEGLVEPYIGNGDRWVVVVDSLSGAHEFKENDSEMRKLLQALSRLAAEYGVAIIVAHHSRKLNGGPLTIDSIRGSSVIVQFSRSVIGLDEPIPDGPVRVRSLKSNFAKKPDPFGFRLDGGGFELCDVPEAAHSKLKVEYGADFLRDVLSDGPLPPKRIFELGDAEGFNETLLRRAQVRIGVISDDGRWKLPSLN